MFGLDFGELGQREFFERFSVYNFNLKYIKGNFKKKLKKKLTRSYRILN